MTANEGVDPGVCQCAIGNCGHWSDCAVHNEPAYPAGECDCGGYPGTPNGYVIRNGMRVLDRGHEYELGSLDGDYVQRLRFVKRFAKTNPEKYPGNANAYPGTTLQIALRVLLNRVKYLQGQKWCIENVLIRLCLMLAIWLLEFRAARRHGAWYLHGLKFAAHGRICDFCGHTACDHYGW